MKKISTLFIGAMVLTFANAASAQVTPPAEVQPDIVLKADRESDPVGDGVYGTPEGQSIRVATLGKRPARFGVALQNDDETENSRIRFRASHGGRLFDVRYSIGGRNVTAQLVRGTALPVEAGGSVNILASAVATSRTIGRPAKTVLRFSAASGELTDSAAAFILKKPAERGAR